MVGLPARGKSYMSKAIVRYLNFIGCPCTIFNAGNKRRTQGKAGADASFFDPNNQQAKAAKEQMAMDTLEDLFKWLKESSSLACGIFDATNTTSARRRAVVERCARERPPVQVVFLESVCDDEELLQHNYRMKLGNDDYKGAAAEKALGDFIERVRAYERVYESITDEEMDALRREREGGCLVNSTSAAGDDCIPDNLGYIQVINAGKKLIASHCEGVVCNNVLTLLQAVHLAPRKITLVLTGQSENDKNGIRGGDSPLSTAGLTYTEAVCAVLREREDPRKPPAHILSGTLRRYTQLHHILHRSDAMRRSHFQIKALNEINFGSLELLAGGRLRDSFPEEFEAREADKLHYRYPGAGGESYLDLVVQLKPTILNIERMRDDAVIVCDVAVARVLLGYFDGVPTETIPDIPIAPGLFELTRSHSGFVIEHVEVDAGVPSLLVAGELSDRNPQLPRAPPRTRVQRVSAHDLRVLIKRTTSGLGAQSPTGPAWNG